MKYLGIDFGSKRVGIAVSDETSKLAFPHSVVLNNESLIEEILDIIKKENISKIVIGESKDFKGEPNKIMVEIEKFKKELEAKSDVRIFFEPEFLTSHQAEQFQHKDEMTDARAAAIILQSFLDRDKN